MQQDSSFSPIPAPQANDLDKPITLRQLAEIAGRELGSKRPLHLSTVRAWANPNRGKKGVVLETYIRIGVRMTTRRMYEKFKADVNRTCEETKEELQERARRARDRALVVRLERQRAARAEIEALEAQRV